MGCRLQAHAIEQQYEPITFFVRSGSAGTLAVHGRLPARLLVAAVEHSLMVHIAGWADNVGTGWGVDDAKARNHRGLLARYGRDGAADLGTS